MSDTSHFRQLILNQGLFAAWLLALIATLGSLYFSEIIGYIPCDLCWYQRICMYPLVVLLLIAVVRKDNQIALYVLPLASIGACIALYHYLKQKLPYFQELPDTCSLVPCTTININWFGFVTIPFLSLVAFILISMLSFIVWKFSRSDSQ